VLYQVAVPLTVSVIVIYWHFVAVISSLIFGLPLLIAVIVRPQFGAVRVTND